MAAGGSDAESLNGDRIRYHSVNHAAGRSASAAFEASLHRNSGCVFGRIRRDRECPPSEHWPARSSRRARLGIRRSLLATHGPRYGDDVQRGLLRVLERPVGPPPHSASGCSAVHDFVHIASVFTKPPGNVLSAGDCGARVGDLLYTDVDVRSDCVADAAGDLRYCGLCRRHRLYQQHGIRAAGLVRRASLVALDLLECRGLHAAHDDLRLFRRSPPKCAPAPEAELARLRLLQRGPGPAGRGSRPGRTAGLVELWCDRRNARGGTVPGWRGLGQADETAKPGRKSSLPEDSEHHHPRGLHFRLQVHPVWQSTWSSLRSWETSSTIDPFRRARPLPGWQCRSSWWYG